MRNQYPSTCYRCNRRVNTGDGHFERHNGGWRTQHAHCAIQHRAAKTLAAKTLAAKTLAALQEQKIVPPPEGDGDQ